MAADSEMFRALRGPAIARGALLLLQVLSAPAARAEDGAPDEVEQVAPPEASDFDPDRATEQLVAARKAELEASGYRFCHDPQFGRRGVQGTDLCVIFDETSDQVCPEARKSCPGWTEMPSLAKGPIEARSRVARRSISMPWLPRLKLPPILAYLLIAAAVLLALFGFARSLKNAGWEDENAAFTGDTQQISLAARNLQALPEARSVVLLKLADRALERNDPRECAILIHLAVLRYLDDEGLARYHPSKTNGDYLRAIRRHRALAELFRSIANQTERIRFGDGEVDVSLLGSQLASGRTVLLRGVDENPPPIAPQVTALILCAGVLAASQAACIDETPDPAFHSQAPAGMSALPKLLAEAGFEAKLSAIKLTDVPQETEVVVLHTSAASGKPWPEDLSLDPLLDRGISVVVIDDLRKSRFFLPVTATLSAARTAVDLDTDLDLGRPCAMRLAELDDFSNEDRVVVPRGWRMAPALDEAGTGTAAASTHRIGAYRVVQYKEPGELDRHLAVAMAGERADTGEAPSGCIYVFADRDLFTNASMTRETNARFVATFFALLAPKGKVMLLDRFTSTAPEETKRDPSPAKSLRASNMLPFLLQGGLTLVALYLLLGAAFGPLRDPATREHKAFVEHVEAIGKHYAATGPLGLTHASRSLARLVVMRHRDRVRGGGLGGWSAVAQHLAQKLDLEEKDVRAALRLGMDGVSELGSPAVSDPSPSSERMLRTLTRLLGGRDQTAPKTRSS